MSRRPCSFREADIVRAVKAAKKAGLSIAGIACHPDGTIEVLQGESQVRRLSARKKEVHHDPEFLRWGEVET